MKYLIALIIWSISALSYAHHTIQYIDYNKDEVHTIVTAPGIATDIVFEKDEVISYHTFGFQSAWNDKVINRHILTFNSTDPEPETNLLVYTNKRHYVFSIVSGKKNWRKNPRSSGAYFSNRMRYSDNKTMAYQKEHLKKQRLSDKPILKLDSCIYNNYDKRSTIGADLYEPIHTCDDGIMTLLIFKEGTKRGTIYELDSIAKQERLLNFNTEKDGRVILHGVYENLMIRFDNHAVQLQRLNTHGLRENKNKTMIEGKVRRLTDELPSVRHQKKATPVRIEP